MSVCRRTVVPTFHWVHVLLFPCVIVPTYHCAHVSLNRALKIWCQNVSLCPHIIEPCIENTMEKCVFVPTCHCAHISFIENLMYECVIVPTYHWTVYWKSDVKMCHCAHMSLCLHMVVSNIENLICLSTHVPSYTTNPNPTQAPPPPPTMLLFKWCKSRGYTAVNNEHVAQLIFLHLYQSVGRTVAGAAVIGRQNEMWAQWSVGTLD